MPDSGDCLQESCVKRSLLMLVPELELLWLLLLLMLAVAAAAKMRFPKNIENAK